MKWLVALVALTIVGAVVAAVKVVFDNRDEVPGNTVACVRKAGLAPVRSRDSLALMRGDVEAGTLHVVRRWDWGRTSGVLIRGAASTDYRVLALWSGDSPSLAGDAALARVYERPNQFPLVATEAPAKGVLEGCAVKN